MKNETGEWEYFHWISADILDPADFNTKKDSHERVVEERAVTLISEALHEFAKRDVRCPLIKL